MKNLLQNLNKPRSLNKMNLTAICPDGTVVIASRDLPYCREGWEYLSRDPDHSEMHLKKGNQIQPHFARIGKSSYEKCSEPKSWAHFYIQKYFADEFHLKPDCIECTDYLEDYGVQPDVILEKFVIEVQHSSMSVNEIVRRNSVYRNLGFNVIWIFHAKEENRSGEIEIGNYLKPMRYNNVFRLSAAETHVREHLYFHYPDGEHLEIFRADLRKITGYHTKYKLENKTIFGNGTRLLEEFDKIASEREEKRKKSQIALPNDREMGIVRELRDLIKFKWTERLEKERLEREARMRRIEATRARSERHYRKQIEKLQISVTRTVITEKTDEYWKRINESSRSRESRRMFDSFLKDHRFPYNWSIKEMLQETGMTLEEFREISIKERVI